MIAFQLLRFGLSTIKKVTQTQLKTPISLQLINVKELITVACDFCHCKQSRPHFKSLWAEVLVDENRCITAYSADVMRCLFNEGAV